jgi:hypothetical protein
MRSLEEKTELGQRQHELALASLPQRWRFWRSPADQPLFARPALLVIAALVTLAYSWGADSASLEPFYGAAARSMSMSWHDFLFGAFDRWANEYSPAAPSAALTAGVGGDVAHAGTPTKGRRLRRAIKRLAGREADTPRDPFGR